VSARAKRRRSYAEIPDLDPNDAGFLRDWGPTALGAAAARFQHHSGAHGSATLPPPGTAAPSPPPPPAKPVELRDEEGDEDAPDDVMAALALLRAQFPAAGRAAGMGPLMLKSQLYALVPDRTLVDRRIDELRCARAGRSPWPALRCQSAWCKHAELPRSLVISSCLDCASWGARPTPPHVCNSIGATVHKYVAGKAGMSECSNWPQRQPTTTRSCCQRTTASWFAPCPSSPPRTVLSVVACPPIAAWIELHLLRISQYPGGKQ